MAQPSEWLRYGNFPRIYAAPVHVSPSAGKGRRNLEVRNRAVSPRVCVRFSDVALLVPGGCASRVAVRTQGGGAAVGRELRDKGAWA